MKRLMEERAKEEKKEEGETTVGFGNNEVSAYNYGTCASRLQN